MLHVGLTGNIASGKSTVSSLLAARGASIIDADVLARRVVEPGTAGLAAIREYFGNRVIMPDGQLDREALRRVVFSNPVARDTLNQIVHPRVAALRDEELQRARDRGERVVISDIPLLFETGLEHAFEAIVFVDAPQEVRLGRLMQNRSLPEADARAMMSAQWPSAEKRARSTFVVDNSGSLDALAPQVDELWESLQTLADRRRTTSG
ncbi:MAG: dephospho-CoA kinase [Phycisphaerae bacterium]|nr:dephospho-CoA kinase [Gemmatimonadaceae bacterium]